LFFAKPQGKGLKATDEEGCRERRLQDFTHSGKITREKIAYSLCPLVRFRGMAEAHQKARSQANIKFSSRDFTPKATSAQISRRS